MRASLVLTLALSACHSRTPTYHQDIAPLILRECNSCHHTGGVAPIPALNDYANAKMYAQPIALAIEGRRMPPYGADDTGLCGHWKDARWLSGDQIATVVRWQKAGAPEGDPEPSPPAPTVDTHFRADATLATGGVYRPGIGAGGNRCFIADPNLDRDRLLSAMRVSSNDPRALGQITLFALDSTEAEAQAAALDSLDDKLGYPCYGDTRTKDARMVASWTWPDPILRLPAGLRVAARRKMIVQIHYDVAHTSGSYQSDTRVDLEFDDHQKEGRMLVVSATGTTGSLAPAERYVSVENSLVIQERMRVVGIAPRMHIRGSVQHLTVERGTKSTCLADFDHWHTQNQQLFRAREPAVLEPGDRILLSCNYNTLGRSEPVRFGQDIDDEECTAWLLVTDFVTGRGTGSD